MQFTELKEPRVPNKIKKRVHDGWSDEECLVLANNYRSLDMDELRRKLGGRSEASIRTKVSRLIKRGWVI